jgi:hypothetical protein
MSSVLFDIISLLLSSEKSNLLLLYVNNNFTIVNLQAVLGSPFSCYAF